MKRGTYILTCMEQITMNGDCYTYKDDLFWACKRVNGKLEKDTFVADMASLVKDDSLHCQGRRVYLTKTWQYEQAAAQLLGQILQDNQVGYGVTADQISSEWVDLTDEQKQGIVMGLNHRLSMVLGGAGTGKTTLIRGLAQHRCRRGVGQFVVCAPTGKAAINLWARTGIHARTVHGALGRLPDQNFLAPVVWDTVGLVVVDEASMVTLEMLAGILSIAPPTCSIVLVGDPNQLQSVGSGNVIPDLCALGIPSITLQTSHRQSDQESALFHNVRHFPEMTGLQDLKFDESFQMIQARDVTEIAKVVQALGTQAYLSGADVQVLSPFYSSGIVSAKALSESLQSTVNPATVDMQSITVRKQVYWEGDRVMITHNDWERGVCNGEIGRFRVLKHGAYGVQIRDVTTTWDNLLDSCALELAYAITVHKSQGSEYDCVILPICRQFGPLLYRNLIYTAISMVRNK